MVWERLLEVRGGKYSPVLERPSPGKVSQAPQARTMPRGPHIERLPPPRVSLAQAGAGQTDPHGMPGRAGGLRRHPICPKICPKPGLEGS